jgi:hypothetical protein
LADVDELARSLNAVAARLREIGDGGLARELQAAAGRAVDPLKDRIRASLRPHLPDPYADVLAADLKVTRSASLGAAGDTARVTVLTSTAGTRKRKLRQLDDGILFHPVFGNRKDWREQGEPSVKPGWFSDPVEESAPEIRDAIEQALDNVVEKAVREGP